MSKVVILGAGVMGSAMALPLADNRHQVHLVGTHLDTEIIDSVSANHFHPRLRVHLPEMITAHHHHQLGTVLDDHVELIVIGVSSLGVVWAAETLAKLGRASLPPLLMITKGLGVHDAKLEIMPHLMGRLLGEHGLGGTPVAAVAGPCIAAELAVRRTTYVSFTHEDPGVLHWLMAQLRTPYYHIRPNTEIIGVEACAALKNFYALGIGFADGMLEAQPTENQAKMHNPTAGLFAQAILELKYLVSAMGGDPATVDGLPGVGDLYVTCQGGRNSRMGRLLGKGLRYSEAKVRHMPDDSVEGAELAMAIADGVQGLFANASLDPARLPLMRLIFQSVVQDQVIELDWAAFH